MKRLLVRVALVFGLLAGVLPTPALAAPLNGCDVMNSTFWDGVYSTAAMGNTNGFQFLEGDTIRITTEPPVNVDLEMYVAMVGVYASGMTPLEYTFDEPYYAENIRIEVEGQSSPLFTVSCEPASEETASGPVVGAPCENLFDGRINDNQSKDCAAPVAVYVVDGRVDVYAINPNTGEGTLVISSGEPADDTEPEGSGNVLLGSSGNIQLYWLPGTNEYLLLAQYADGKPYQIVWSGDGSDLRHVTA